MYIQVLGIMVLIAFVYVATNKKTLKFDFGTKKDNTEGAADATDAEADDNDNDEATDDNGSEAESEADVTPEKTVRFEADA
jgi:hypothetical protein